MKGRIWLVVGVLLGVAIAAGDVPYFAGAARSLTDDAQRVVGTGGAKLIALAADHGAPQRAVLGLTSLVAVLIPGVTALLLVVAARTTGRLRRVISLLLGALAIAAFAYQPAGDALGAMVLGLGVAGLAVTLSGPLVMVPLAALAAMIGAKFLPQLLAGTNSLPNAPVSEMHRALFATPGNAWGLRVALLVVAAVPFAVAARLVLRP